MSKQKYLVGIDGSEWSERALARAVDLATKTKAEIEIVYVMSWSLLEPVFMEGQIEVPELRTAEENKAKKEVVEPLLTKYSDSGVAFNLEVQWGDPAHVLHKLAKRKHANMVFVGRKGRSRIADLFVGSVANKLAHTIGIPIVLVP